MKVCSDLSKAGIAVIRLFSTLNQWMDCVFLVMEEDKEYAIDVLDRVWNQFWEQNDEPYGDFLENALYEVGIEYEVFYTNKTEED